MIARTSVRWRLVAWVTGVLVAVAAVIFVVVYEQTGTELRAEVDQDVAGDLSQLSQAVKGMGATRLTRAAARAGRRVPARPAVQLHVVADVRRDSGPRLGQSNPPALLGSAAPDDGETAAEQARENALGQALLRAPTTGHHPGGA